MNTTVITKKNKYLLDEDIIISYEKEYPYTIFGQVYEKNNGYLEANGYKLHILVYEYYNGVIPINCEIHHINKNKKIYEFYHPSQKYLGGSIDFNKALSKAICNTDDELYKRYLIDKWSKEGYNE